jgi:hypothetical protein
MSLTARYLVFVTAICTLLGGGLFLGLGFAASDLHGETYRYRLTLALEDQGELRSGTTVVEVMSRSNWPASILPGVRSWESQARCEALYVRLGDQPGDNLFVLMGQRAMGLPNALIPGQPSANVGYDYLGTEGKDELRAARGKSFDVPGHELPPMVRFRDLSDPATVEAVSPQALDRSFGRGVRFVGAKLQLTDDPYVSTINAELPWLNRFSGGLALDGKPGFHGHGGYGAPSEVNYFDMVCPFFLNSGQTAK